MVNEMINFNKKQHIALVAKCRTWKFKFRHPSTVHETRIHNIICTYSHNSINKMSIRHERFDDFILVSMKKCMNPPLIQIPGKAYSIPAIVCSQNSWIFIEAAFRSSWKLSLNCRQNDNIIHYLNNLPCLCKIWNHGCAQ